MIRIRTAKAADKPQILSLFAEIFGREKAAKIESFWRWQWELDPRLPYPGYRGSVAEWDGRILGNISWIPAGLYVHGQPVDALWAVNAMVHRGLYRQALRQERLGTTGRERTPGQGRGWSSPPRAISSLLMDHPGRDRILLGKHSSRPMIVVALKNNFRVVEHSGFWVRDLSFTQRLKRWVGPWFAPMLGAVPNVVVGRIPRTSAEVRCFEDVFDDRFNSLWKEVCAQYPAITLRDARTLQWRYRERPDSDYQVLTLEKGAALRGYSILRTYRRRGYLRGRILDLLTRPEDQTGRVALLSASLIHLHARKAERVECYAADPALASALVQAGFRPKKGSDPLMERGASVSRFFISGGDGDGD